jgi:hypothetical protein
MSTIHPSRRLFFGIAALFAFTLLAPAAVTAEDEVAVMAPVAAPAADDTSADGVRVAARALTAQRALLTGDIGSMQEEHLFAIVAAAPSWDATSGCGSVEASRAANGLLAAPATSTAAEQTRALAAQQALLSPDLGSLQEDALAAVVAAGSAEVDASGDDALAPTRAELQAQFLAIGPTFSRSQGAD